MGDELYDTINWLLFETPAYCLTNQNVQQNSTYPDQTGLDPIGLMTTYPDDCIHHNKSVWINHSVPTYVGFIRTSKPFDVKWRIGLNGPNFVSNVSL